MLIYVYGVVPFSLCRTGSYGGVGSGGTDHRSTMNALNMANLDARFRFGDLQNVVRGATGGGGGSKAADAAAAVVAASTSNDNNAADGGSGHKNNSSNGELCFVTHGGVTCCC